MARHIKEPALIEAAGVGQKIIREYIGRVITGDSSVSVARMSSPQGWYEPQQTPEFNEVTFVLAGEVHVQHAGGTSIVKVDEAFLAEGGGTYQYSTPAAGGAQYIAICVPAFSPDSVHREKG